ncbi:MAG: hypothetical protein ABH827_07075 [bacterium]
MKSIFKNVLFVVLCSFVLLGSGALLAIKRDITPEALALSFFSTKKQATAMVQEAFTKEDYDVIDHLMSSFLFRDCLIAAVNVLGDDGEVAFNALKWAVERGDQVAQDLLLEDEDARLAIESFCNSNCVSEDVEDIDEIYNAGRAYELLCLAREKKNKKIESLVFEFCCSLSGGSDKAVYVIVSESIEKNNIDMFKFLKSYSCVREMLQFYFCGNQDCAVEICLRAIEQANFGALEYIFSLKDVVYLDKDFRAMIAKAKDLQVVAEEKVLKIIKRIRLQACRQMLMQARTGK